MLISAVASVCADEFASLQILTVHINVILKNKIKLRFE